MRIEKSRQKKIVQQYEHGISVSELSKIHQIPRSTLYVWINKYKKLPSKSDVEITTNQFYLQEEHIVKLENMIEILQTVNCNYSSPLKEKLYALEELYGQYSVHELCEALGVSRETFYNHVKRNKKDDTLSAKRKKQLQKLIQEVFDENHQIFGGNKIRAILKARGIQVSEEYVCKIMREMGLKSIHVNAKKSNKKLQSNKKVDLLQCDFEVVKPNQVWVADITTFKYKNHYYYICVILDLYARKVVACKVSLAATTQLVTKTFKLAYNSRNITDELIFHSDRGTQFTSYAFRKLLKDLNVIQSFSKPHSPYHNSVIESFFSNLKQEELYRRNYKSKKEFLKAIEDYIIFYNEKRPHKSNNYLTPAEKERK